MRVFLLGLLATVVLGVSYYVGARFPTGKSVHSRRKAQVLDDDLASLVELASEIEASRRKMQAELDRSVRVGTFRTTDAEDLVELIEDLKDQLWVLGHRADKRDAAKFQAAEAARTRALLRSVDLRPALLNPSRRRRHAGLTAVESELRALIQHLRGIEKTLSGP